MKNFSLERVIFALMFFLILATFVVVLFLVSLVQKLAPTTPAPVIVNLPEATVSATPTPTPEAEEEPTPTPRPRTTPEPTEEVEAGE